MKKLLFLPVLFSSAFSFTAVPRMVAPANAPINHLGMRHAQAFNLIKEALERKAWDRGEPLSKEEIKEILNIEKKFLLKDQYAQYLSSQEFRGYYTEVGLFYAALGGWTGALPWALVSRQSSSFRYYAIFGLLAGMGYCGLKIFNEARGYGFPGDWLALKKLESSGYQRILDSRFTQVTWLPNQIDYFYYWLVSDDLDIQESTMLFLLQKLYPHKYLDIESLKLKPSEKEMQVMQALVADRTYADGTQRRVNTKFAQEMYAFLAAPGNK